MQQSGSLVVASVVERCSTMLPEGFDAQVESCRRVGASSVLRTTTSSLDRAGSCMEAYFLMIDSLTPPGFGPPPARGRRGLG